MGNHEIANGQTVGPGAILVCGSRCALDTDEIYKTGRSLLLRNVKSDPFAGNHHQTAAVDRQTEAGCCQQTGARFRILSPTVYL